MMRGVVVYFMQGVCRYLEKNKLTVSTLFFVSNFLTAERGDGEAQILKQS